jgi:diamine N-acetyltransferase
MAGVPVSSPAFHAARYDLEEAGLWLSAVTPDEAVVLGEALAAIEPWTHYGAPAAGLTALFAPAADGGIRLAVRSLDSTAPLGVMAIRHPWLAGPYMQLLALLSGAQGQGHGQALLAWFEAEARSGGARNLWICVSAFNSAAQRLYLRFGFERVTILDDLIKPGIDEILMRKRLA